MLFQDFAPSVVFETEKNEIKNEIRTHQCILLRYISHFDNPDFTEFWYIIKDKFIPIEEFSKNTRNQVKKGLNNCEVRKVTGDFFRLNCYEIYKSSILSYNQTPISKEEFEATSYVNEERDLWVVFAKDSNIPIGYSSNKIMEDSCNYAYIKFHTDYLSLYPSYALHYEMDKYYLEDNKVNYVNVGARSLFHETGVQDFLIRKFKYRKAFCKLNVVYSPWLGFTIKLLSPFRELINRIPSKRLGKVRAILKQHKIASS